MIKKILCLSLALSAFAVSASPGAFAKDDSEESTASAKKLTWDTQFSKGLERAKKEHKFILADIYTDWCGWCKRLDIDTFADPEFQNFANEKFVMVKVNAEDRGEGTKVAQENDVSGFPSGLVFNSEGKFLGKIFGYKKPAQYQQELAKIIKHETP